MHSFSKYCIDPAALVATPTLKNFIAALFKQANMPGASVPYNDKESDSEQKIKAPRYFGAGGEFLAEVFFKTFGNEFNVHGLQFNDDAEREYEDTGSDATGVSIKKQLYKHESRTFNTNSGSRVFVQVKTVTNPVKEFMTNDGSRIMNFFGNAQMQAAVIGHSFQARYLLWTTGKDLHWKLKKNTGGFIEVINYSKISKMIDNNPVFWNNVREVFNLPILPIPLAKADPLFLSMQKETELQS